MILLLLAQRRHGDTHCPEDFEALDDPSEDGALAVQRGQRFERDHELGVVAVRLGGDGAQQSCESSRAGVELAIQSSPKFTAETNISAVHI